ncbi:reverse transcriptase domain-containing protein [Tanacetum coccineum]
MSTRSTSSNLYSPLRDPESLIRRRNLGESSSLFDFEEVMSIPHNNIGPPPAGPPPSNYNGPPPMVRPNGPGPRSMEELCQPSINGRGGPIAPIPIQATDFGLRHHMIQQQNGVSDDALHLSLFLYSLTHHAIAWYDRPPRNSNHSFDDMMRKFLSKYFLPSMVTKLRNEITKFEQKPHESLFEAWEPIGTPSMLQREELLCKRHRKNVTNLIGTDAHTTIGTLQQLETRHLEISLLLLLPRTYGGPHSFIECPAVSGYTQEAAYATTVDTSLIHIESRKSPTAVLFDDDTGRISIRHCEY